MPGRVADDVDDLRQVDDHQPVARGQDVVRRQVAVRRRRAGPSRPSRRAAARSTTPAAPARGRVCASRGARLAVDGDPLHQDLGAVDLHRVGDRDAGSPEPLERVPLRDRPTGRRRPAGRARSSCARGRARRGSAWCGGPRCRRRAVEGAVLLAAVALGGHHDAARRGRPGRPARARKTSASLPVLRMPSSVSMAAWMVTTQSGRGSGPRQSGSTLEPGGPALAVAGVVVRRGSRRRSAGSSSGVEARAVGQAGRWYCGSRETSVWVLHEVREGSVCGQAEDSDGHVTAPLGSWGLRTQRRPARPWWGPVPGHHKRISGWEDVPVSPRDVVILGSTGSIGTQALDLVRANPDRFRVVGLTAGGSNPELFDAQVAEFAPGVLRAGGGGLGRGRRRGRATSSSTASPAPSGCARRWPRSTPATRSRWPTRSR